MSYAVDRSLPNTSPSYSSTLSPASPSSIRGSLDPPLKSKKPDRQGWRYLQCSNVKDELRVLLPPRPAAIYANLLKVEVHLLARNDPESMQEVKIISILKDAMIERCEKLAMKAQLSSPQSRTRLVEAPMDFKLKRLEKWWEAMEASGRTKSSAGRVRTRSAEQSRYPTMKAKGSSKEDHTPPPTANSFTKRASPISHTYAQSALRPPYPGETPSNSSIHSSFNASRKNSKQATRPAPLSVIPARHNPDQISISPSVAHAPRAPDQVVYQASQDHPLHNNAHYAQGHSSGRPPLRHSVAYNENHSASPVEAPVSPFVTVNASTLYSHHMGSSTDINGSQPMAQLVYPNRSTNASTIKSPAADPSHLKDRFHAQYMAASSDSNSSSSLTANKQPSSAAQPYPYAVSDPSRRASSELLSAPNSQSAHTRDPRIHRSSFSMPVPSLSPSASYQEHRRRATVDGDDTDRSVQRIREYMYPVNAYSRQASTNGGVYTEAARKVNRIYQTPSACNSPQSSGSQSSPYTQDGSRMRSSPSRGFQTQRVSPQHLTHDSPNLLPPAPALAQRRGSYESDASANGRQRSPRMQDTTASQPKLLRKTHSRRGLRDEAAAAQDNNQQAQVLSRYDDPQGAYTRGRTRRGERSPRRRYSYDPSPHREGAVIPDMSILSPISSIRDSRYTSGDSSVSEPVIPDASLIREAKLERGKGERVRRRLVPTRSSSESGGDGLRADWDDDDSSADEAEYVRVDLNEASNGNGAYYKRPYRTRDGYGSGYNSEVEGQRSRAPSRTPSRPPSRGILKRSSSACSARSTKSVRIEIPRDRRALEEVRDAEDKVEAAQRQLDLLRQDKGNSESEIRKATKALDEAKNSVRDKEENYHAILALLKEKEKEKRIDIDAPKYV